MQGHACPRVVSDPLQAIGGALPAGRIPDAEELLERIVELDKAGALAHLQQLLSKVHRPSLRRPSCGGGG